MPQPLLRLPAALYYHIHRSCRSTQNPEMTRGTQFRIRIVAGSSVSIGVGVEAMMIDIWDVTNNLLCVYELRGLSFGAGTPVAVALRGPWNDFRTLAPMSCAEFGGLARFATLFVMDKSVNGLVIEPLGWFPVEVAPFETGWTLGFGIGAGGGAFVRMFPPIDASEAWWPHNIN